jgi:hypothetical protein
MSLLTEGWLSKWLGAQKDGSALVSKVVFPDATLEACQNAAAHLSLLLLTYQIPHFEAS